MKSLFFLLFAACHGLTLAQVVTITDATTGEPVPGVAIYAREKTVVVTEHEGKADLSAFAGEDSIRFHYPGYKPVCSSYNDVKSRNFKVELEQSNIALSEVVVSASRWEGDKSETPNRVEKLNMKEVRFQNPQTTADLLGTSGYVYVQKSQLGGGSPMLRGMATNRVLLVIDGVRMNNAIFRAGNLQNVISLDPHALESTEVLFGPGSVMYGSDAIGGVMNFTTLQPRLSDSLDKGMYVGGNALARHSTANMEKTGHLDLKLGSRKLAFVSGVTYSDYDDLRSGSKGGANSFYRPYYVHTSGTTDFMVRNNDSSLQVGSGYSQLNLMQKVRFRPGEKLDMEYGFHYSATSSYNRYDRLYVMRRGNPRFAEWYYGPQLWSMHRLSVAVSGPAAAYDRLRFIAALQNFEESRFDREFGSPDRHGQKENVQALSFNLDFEKSFARRSSLYYGAEVLSNLVRSSGSLTNAWTGQSGPAVSRYPDGSTWRSGAIYAGLRQRLTRKIMLSAGARYSLVRINADFDTTFFPFPFTRAEMRNGNLNGSLGVVHTLSRSAQVYANAATGFRSPNIDDMGKVFESTPGFLVVANPNLKPEQAYNLEAGGVKAFGSIMKVDGAVYYTLLQNAMERRNTTFNGSDSVMLHGNNARVQSLQNVVMARVYGLQAGLEIAYRGFGVRSTISYQRGEEQSKDSLNAYPLRHAAPLFGATHLTYARKKLKLDFYAIYNGRMDYEDLALTERVNVSYARDAAGRAYSGSWHTLNFKAAWYPARSLALSAGVENIADILYRPYSSGINAPGRNFIVSLQVRF